MGEVGGAEAEHRDLQLLDDAVDAPDEDVTAGWFEGRAQRVFERRSDDRFLPRSRR